MYDLFFDGNSNVCSIYYQLLSIHTRNVYVLDFDHLNGPRSKTNMLVEIQYMTSYFMAIVMCALSVAVCEIFAFEFPKCTHLSRLTVKKK